MKIYYLFCLFVLLSLSCARINTATSPNANLSQGNSSPTSTYTPFVPIATPYATITITYVPSASPNASPIPTRSLTEPPTFTPTNTPIGWITPTFTPTFSIPSTGIMLEGWFGAGPLSCGQFIGSIAVNGYADPTAILALGMPSGPITIPISASTTYSGGTTGYYAQSGLSVPQPGESYTLTAYTSIGTASVTAICPGPITISSDGLTIGWVHDGTMADYSIAPPNYGWGMYGNGDGIEPFVFPASDFSTPGKYQYYVFLYNRVSNIQNAPGYYSFFNVRTQFAESITH